MNKYEEYYDDLSKSMNPNMDCSEITENFIRLFGGEAVLILSNKWETYDMFEIRRRDMNKVEYNYHYAWVSPDNKIYDILLGYRNINIEDYMRFIDIDKSKVSIKRIKSDTLKCYC